MAAMDIDSARGKHHAGSPGARDARRKSPRASVVGAHGRSSPDAVAEAKAKLAASDAPERRVLFADGALKPAGGEYVTNMACSAAATLGSERALAAAKAKSKAALLRLSTELTRLRTEAVSIKRDAVAHLLARRPRRAPRRRPRRLRHGHRARRRGALGEIVASSRCSGRRRKRRHDDDDDDDEAQGLLDN